MEKYSAVACPNCGSFKVGWKADCTSIIKDGGLVKEAAANAGEVYTCQVCEEEFVTPATHSDSDEKSE